MKNEKGITLISLVITIIVLLILATISINAGTGTIRYSNYNKAKAEMQAMQDNVNSWYDEYNKLGTVEEKTNYINNSFGGVPASEDSSCDQTKLTNTMNDVQEKGYTVNAVDFRFLSAQYLKNNIGMDFEYDYLVNIPDRQVILFDGILYDGKKYYTAEDFGILNVEINEPNSISFDLESGGYTEIIISNLKILDRNLNESDISKFLVEYKKSSDTDWSDATASVIKFTENNQTKFKFSVPEEKAKTETYNVKISTVDKKISKIYSSSIVVNFPYVLASFEANGGTVDTASKLVKIGGTYEDLPTPTREGYTFKGWANENLFSPQDFYEIGKDYSVDIEDNNIVLGTYPYQENVTKLPISCKDNTQYTLSYDWKINQLLSGTQIRTGLKMGYTDGTSTGGVASAINLVYGGLNDTGHVNITSTLGKTIQYISSAGWQYSGKVILSNIRLVEGVTEYITSNTRVTQYVDHILTAIWEENS